MCVITRQVAKDVGKMNARNYFIATDIVSTADLVTGFIAIDHRTKLAVIYELVFAFS